MAKPLVFIFARAPRYGAVKSRLAREIGAGEAIRFYRHTLSGVVRRLRNDERFEVVLAVTPDCAREGLPAGLRIVGQGGGDLGRRMVRVLRAAGARPAAVIGSDIPQVSGDHITAAFAAMGRADVVLGGTPDGGYWLIGARHPARLAPNVLDGVRWSSAHTLADTVARVSSATALDFVLEDVDDGAAYRRNANQPISRNAPTRRATSLSS
jgi:hypothetical protein